MPTCGIGVDSHRRTRAGQVEASTTAGRRISARNGFLRASNYDRTAGLFLDQGLPFRPDGEAVVTPVVDFALALPEVDPDWIVLHGWSLAATWPVGSRP